MMMDGRVEILSNSDNVEVEVRDYDVDDVYDPDDTSCKTDDRGRYQEFLFPAEKINNSR